ncbi:DUF2267 domain-containing protein [Pseudonocardia acidicola]|uniref:DUF2267 domain-containing protein n=1 Tax=Pseudonocardia acidicola TaxID=2724939 RepID=A0ABX1SHM7_9PSEU|nr:DUF2267 domain-containing protein [Pseudonocardia acidicola]NMI00283.1 DUF2267 domain-containing protein [Pseudonocardia acidicola]
MDDREFYRTVAERTGLSREEAADLSRATMQAIAARMSPGEVDDLAMLLPDQLADSLKSGRGRPSKRKGLLDIKQQVMDRTRLNEQEVHDGVRGVLTTLRDAVPEDAFTQAMGQLPGEFRSLLEEAAEGS